MEILLQFVYGAKFSMKYTVKLYHVSGQEGVYASVQFGKFSLTFNTIIPEHVHTRLAQLSVPKPL